MATSLYPTTAGSSSITIPGLSLPGPNDPNTMTSYANDITSLINANPAQGSITSNPAFQQALQLLQPGSNGLSNSLTQMLNLGQQTIQGQTNDAVASALGNAQASGLAGSSIQGANVGAAQYAGSQALASLLGSLFGLQNQNTGSAASMLGGAASTEGGFGQNELMSLIGYLTGNQSDLMNLNMFSQEQQQANALADRQLNASNNQAYLGAGTDLLSLL